MPLKFKVQRQPIIPAGSWDKNPMVQHAEIWCCSLLLISFDWKGRKKKNKEGSRKKLKALWQPSQPSSLLTPMERKLPANWTQKDRKNQDLETNSSPGVSGLPRRGCVCLGEFAAAAGHSLEEVMQLQNSPRASTVRHGPWAQNTSLRLAALPWELWTPEIPDLIMVLCTFISCTLQPGSASAGATEGPLKREQVQMQSLYLYTQSNLFILFFF